MYLFRVFKLENYMTAILRGTGVALITPFTQDNQVDHNALRKIVSNCIDNQVDYLVVLGTTAETPTLTNLEKQAVIDTIIAENNNRLPLVLGIGSNNTQTVIEQIEAFDLESFVAVLSVVPMYNKPSQEGIFNHYKAIADIASKPILLYNVPSRTGVNMSAGTTLKLAQHNNIIGIKEASSDFGQVLRILKDKPDDFLVISGDDELALPLISAGGDGVISVIGQSFPKDFSTAIRLNLEGKTKQAYQKLYDFIESIDYAFEEGNPVGIKAILAKQGMCLPDVRMPLMPASENLQHKIDAFIEANNLS